MAARVVLRAPVTGGEVMSHGIRVDVGGAEPTTLMCKTLINCAGHGAPPLARAIAGVPADKVPRNFFRRGVYFSVTGRPFKRLIYPMHGPGGMDIHAVIDLAGNVRFGPDVEWVDRLDYSVDPNRAEAFYRSIRTFWPALPDGALAPAYAGIRPKITGPDEAAADFRDPGAARPWHPASRQPVRHRVARADVVAGDRRIRCKDARPQGADAA